MRNATVKPGERGFTLVELMLVILIIGILAAIAIFAVRPFERAAIQTCFDTELTLADVIAAAAKAGIDIDDLPQDECVPIVLLLGAAVENFDSVVTLNSQPAQGHTIVAISAHRSGASPGPQPVICSGDQYLPFNPGNGLCTADTAGWTLAGYHNVGSGQTGRGIAVWTKIAGPNEPTVIRARWPGWDATNNSKSLLVGVFNRRLHPGGITFNDSGAALVNSLDLGTATGGSGPAVVVGSVATRAASSGVGPCTTSGPTVYHCVNFSGVTGITKVNHAQPSSVFNMMAWASVRNGPGPHTVHAEWERDLVAVGFTLVLNLFE